MTETAQGAPAAEATSSTEPNGDQPLNLGGESLDSPAEPTENSESAIMKEDAEADPKLSPQQIERLLKSHKFKVSVDGEDAELGYDDLIKVRGLEKSYTRKFQEISQEKDALSQFLSSAKENPRMVFDLATKLGHDPKQLAKDLIWEEIQYEKMSPVEKELLAERREKQALTEKLKKYTETEEQTKKQALSSRYEQEIEQDVMSALKLSKLKPTPKTVARIAEVFQHGFRANGQRLTPEQAAKIVRQTTDQDFSDFAENTSGEEFYERLPKTTQKAIKDYLIKKAQGSQTAKLQASHNGTTKESKPSKSKKIGMNDFFKNL